MSQSLALQSALRALFVASADVVALVPAANIVDRNLRPPPSPSIVLGEEDSGPDEGNANGDRTDRFHDVHVWLEEPSTVGCKAIMGAMRRALRLSPRPVLEGGYHLADWQVWRERVFRDPDGKMSHGVMTVRAAIGGDGE